MDNSRFLILGAYGQLGKALQAQYPKAIASGRDTLDLTSLDSLESFDWSSVDIILNAAAYTNVDGAEASEGRIAAWQVNAHAPSYLSRIASEHNLTLVHFSTDYVFDGIKSPHTEEESFTPLSVYGQSKAAGDVAVSITPKHYTLRTSWVIGEGKNFVRTMMGLAEKNISPTVVADQIGRLTFTVTLVDAVDHLLKTKAAYGTYNVTNDGDSASWADITRAVFKELGREDLTVTDTTTAEYFADKSDIAPRPLQSTLDLAKVKATGLKPRDWHDDLRKYIANEQQKEQA